MRLIPTGNRILVRPQTPEKMTPGGLLIPDASKKQKPLGTIVALGPDTKGYILGDLVYYQDFAALPIDLTDGKDVLLMLTPDDILGIVEVDEDGAGVPDG